MVLLLLAESPFALFGAASIFAWLMRHRRREDPTVPQLISTTVDGNFSLYKYYSRKNRDWYYRAQCNNCFVTPGYAKNDFALVIEGCASHQCGKGPQWNLMSKTG